MRYWRSKAVLVLMVGVVCIAVGLSRGEDVMVFNKAIHVCLECIGIG